MTKLLSHEEKTHLTHTLSSEITLQTQSVLQTMACTVTVFKHSKTRFSCKSLTKPFLFAVVKNQA